MRIQHFAQPPYQLAVDDPIIAIRNLDLYYGEAQALKDITVAIPRRQVTAFIGPSGCGKSTLLRCLNRLNDLVDSVRITGSIKLEAMEINSGDVDVIELRRRVGMVFQAYNPFPKSIYENVVYGLRIAGVSKRSILDEEARRSLQSSARRPEPATPLAAAWRRDAPGTQPPPPRR